MRILVTGTGGVVGSAVMRAHLDRQMREGGDVRASSRWFTRLDARLPSLPDPR